MCVWACVCICMCVSVFVKDFFFTFLPSLVFIDSVCVCCSVHFSFSLNLGSVIDVLRGDAENFIADVRARVLTPFRIQKVSPGGLRQQRPTSFITPSSHCVISFWLNSAFLSIADAQMWHLTSAHNFPRSWAAAVDSAGVGKLLMICLNIDFEVGWPSLLTVLLLLTWFYSHVFTLNKRFSACGSSLHHVWGICGLINADFTTAITGH